MGRTPTQYESLFMIVIAVAILTVTGHTNG